MIADYDAWKLASPPGYDASDDEIELGLLEEEIRDLKWSLEFRQQDLRDYSRWRAEAMGDPDTLAQLDLDEAEDRAKLGRLRVRLAEAIERMEELQWQLR
jgi:hypothetical protein